MSHVPNFVQTLELKEMNLLRDFPIELLWSSKQNMKF